MAGCYGSHPLDRWYEQQLNDHLDRLDDDEEGPENYCYDEIEDLIPHEDDGTEKIFDPDDLPF